LSHDHLIPPGVGEHDAALLRRAYALRSQADGEQLYHEWAATYDHTMVDGLGYLSPSLLTAQFARLVDWRDRPIIDLGCGTGLVGAELRGHGFDAVDGLDLSEPMMTHARNRGVYGSLITADLNQPIPIADGAYAAAICNGTFTSGHVGAGCLDEVLRIIEPNGVLSCAVHHSVWDALGFSTRFGELAAEGRLDVVEIIESPYYASSPADDGRLCVLRRR
jgi:SAM-dependent methyltransferase